MFSHSHIEVSVLNLLLCQCQYVFICCNFSGQPSPGNTQGDCMQVCTANPNSTY